MVIALLDGAVQMNGAVALRMRLMYCALLREEEIDFEQNQIIARDGKEMKDRSSTPCFRNSSSVF
jgi:hypothetical protein